MGDRLPEITRAPDLIEAKRKMFLLEYSLQVKREEMNKLDNEATRREKALLRAEAELDKDAAQFDAFLKANNQKTLEASKRADAETKEKLARINTLKKLDAQIGAVRNELSKYDEQLEDCRQYKEFLDKLTPTSWWEEHPHCANHPDAANAADGEEFSEDVAMYFTEPQQLLHIFKDLEENNMFLIQHSQDTERVLDELRVKRKMIEEKMSVEANSLQSQIDALKLSIQKEEEKVASLTARDRSGVAADRTSDIDLKQLGEKVEQVYQECVGDNSASLKPLEMLGRIERRMEDLFLQIEKLPREYIVAAEKQKEKERRTRQRKEKAEHDRVEAEKKVQRALERSQRTAKPVMFRSMPPPKKTKTKKKKKKEESKEDLEYFFG